MSVLSEGSLPQNFTDWLQKVSSVEPDYEILFSKLNNNKYEKWQAFTYSYLFQEVQKKANALISIGIKKGDVLAFIAPNSIEWDIMQYACLSAGIVVLGIDLHAPSEIKNAILVESKTRHIFTDTLSRINDLNLSEINVRNIITLTEYSENESRPLSLSVYSYSNLKSDSGSNLSPQVSTSDPALLIFTSGTTSRPKGLVYTQNQLILALDAIHNHFPEFHEIPLNERVMVCWLPLSNLFQRMLNLFALEHQFKSFYCPDPKQIMELLPDIKPSVLVGVPRFFEKITKEASKPLLQLPSIIRKLAIKALIAPIIKNKLGGKLRVLVSGSAKMPLLALNFFESIGLPIYEIYGMSENIIPMSGNNKANYRKSSVGIPFKYNQLITTGEGEILVKSPGLGTRYPDGVLNESGEPGYIATNDLGHIDADGFVYINGRKDNVIKTSTGIRVLSETIEGDISKIENIDQGIVIGDGRKLLSAILSSNLPQEEVAKSIQKINRGLPEKYRIHGIILSDISFTPLNKLATPNLKLKRKEIENIFAEEIEDLYKKLEDTDRLIIESGLPLVLKANQGA